jgi:hypothetical protein
MPVNKRASGASGMHKICATDSAVAPHPIRGRAPPRPCGSQRAPTSGAGSPRAMPKGGALLRHYCLQYQLEQLVGDRVRRRPMALSIPEPTDPIYRLLTTTMSPVSLGRTQQPPGGLRGERCYILRRAVPKQKPMTQVFAPDLAAAKPSRNSPVGAEDLKAKTQTWRTLPSNCHNA